MSADHWRSPRSVAAEDRVFVFMIANLLGRALSLGIDQPRAEEVITTWTGFFDRNEIPIDWFVIFCAIDKCHLGDEWRPEPDVAAGAAPQPGTRP